MKPHINLRHGIWACYTVHPVAMGCGYTPLAAYIEWLVVFSRQSTRAA